MDRRRYQMDASFRDWPRRPPLSVAASLYFLACVGQLLLMLFSQVLAPRVSGLGGQGLSWAISAAFELGFLLFPAAYYCGGRPGMGRGLRLRRCPPLALCLCALAAVAAVFLADSLGTLWLLLLEALGATLSSRTLPAGGPGNMVMHLLVIALLPALCEEIMFRGLILSAWERRGEKRALIVSALLFASLHGNVQGLPVHLVLGLVLGALVMGADSLYAGCLFHFIYNALLLRLSVGANPSGEPLIVQVGGLGGVGLIVARLIFYGGVVYGLIWAVWARCAGERQQVPAMRQEMELSTLVVLAGGIVTALCIYLIDFLSLWGVL